MLVIVLCTDDVNITWMEPLRSIFLNISKTGYYRTNLDLQYRSSSIQLLCITITHISISLATGEGTMDGHGCKPEGCLIAMQSLSMDVQGKSQQLQKQYLH